MIKVNLGERGGILGISFRHSVTEVALPRDARERRLNLVPRFRKTRGTYAEAYQIVGQGTRWLAEGSAILGEGDQFNKAMGRKVALTRLLKILNLEKKDREKVWEAYRNRGVIEGEAVIIKSEVD